MEQVAVFVDYQNVYKGARWAFGTGTEPARFGQVDPLRLGQLLVARRQRKSELAEVRLYRGLPDGGRDPRGYAATRRQLAAWEAQPGVTAISRPLKYPPDWPQEKAREKGIDVQLAVDLVLGAIEFDFDAAIVFSADTDLIPAAEAVFEVGRHCEVAAWSPQRENGRRIHSDRKQLWCHWLDEADFQCVVDETDYNLPAR